MSLTILLGDVPYPLASAEGWRLASQWVESQNNEAQETFPHLEQLCVHGAVLNTEALDHEIREAIALHPPKPISNTLSELAVSIAGGSPIEIASIAGGGESDWVQHVSNVLRPTSSALARILNAFCPTGPGGGQVNTCPPGNKGAVHPGSGLPIGHWFTKTYQGITYSMQVTATGIQVVAPQTGRGARIYPSLTAAAKAIRGNNTAVNGWVFFGQTKPSQAAVGAPPISTPSISPIVTPPAATPQPSPAPVSSPVTGQTHQTGLAVGTTYTKSYKGDVYKVEVRANDFRVTSSQGYAGTHSSLTAAAMAIRGNTSAVNGWKFFGIPKPTASAGAVLSLSPTPSPPPPIAPATPSPSPAARQSPTSTIPYAPEKAWKTGEAEPGTLNGVPFDSAPHKFWEHVKDVDVHEPRPARPIERALVIIQEKDGRIWVVKPTNEFGRRKYTVPGGTVEKGLTIQQNALKEAWEETGLKVQITKYLGDIEDSNTKRNGRVYLAKRVGGAPWEAKVEANIINRKTGKPDAENESVHLVMPERAMQLLHRTDDQAMLATAVPIDVRKTHIQGEMMKKLVDGLQPAAKQYEKEQSALGQDAGNAELHAVQELRGFTGKPRVVSKSDMDALAKAGTHIEMLRGVKRARSMSGAAIANEFKTGNLYPGAGCFGSGSYFDAGKGRNNAASSYGAGGDIIRAALPKTAKIIEQSELEKIVQSPPSNSTGYNGGFNSRGATWWGTHAALAGYDAIHVDGHSRQHSTYGSLRGVDHYDFYVVLNRSILTVQQESAKGHKIR